MENLTFEQHICASRETVWTVITEHYPQWISAVCGDGARTDGKWAKNEEVQFFAPGGKGGLVSRITEFDKPTNVKWEAVAMLQNGERAEFSAITEMLKGMSEQYQLTDANGETLLTATLKTPAPMREFSELKWPAAMQKIKELAEQLKS